tara:strand:+ start:5649 stop:5879 length:231 start_codon:yes stop_codon:yes gene_type:complete
MFGLYEFMISGAFKVSLAIMAIIAARLTVLWMDKHVNKGESNFAIWINNEKNGTAKAIYYGARWVGVAIIVAGAVS